MWDWSIPGTFAVHCRRVICGWCFGATCYSLAAMLYAIFPGVLLLLLRCFCSCCDGYTTVVVAVHILLVRYLSLTMVHNCTYTLGTSYSTWNSMPLSDLKYEHLGISTAAHIVDAAYSPLCTQVPVGVRSPRVYKTESPNVSGSGNILVLLINDFCKNGRHTSGMSIKCLLLWLCENLPACFLQYTWYLVEVLL